MEKNFKMKKIIYLIVKCFNDFISDKAFVNLLFLFNCFRKNKSYYFIDFNNPKTFNEKINFIKFKNKNPLSPIVADKYSVREYLAKKKHEDLLIPLIISFNNYSEISFDKMSFPCIMKMNNGSGENLIINSKNEFSEDYVKSFFKRSFDKNIFLLSREWHYSKIIPCIVVEKLISSNLIDYKIFCSNGMPFMIQVDIDRFEDHRRNLYDTSWQKLSIEHVYKNYEYEIKKPSKLSEMLSIASSISKDFLFCRVDLYFHEEKIYFGELTLHPEGGVGPFLNYYQDLSVGEKLII